MSSPLAWGGNLPLTPFQPLSQEVGSASTADCCSGQAPIVLNSSKLLKSVSHKHDLQYDNLQQTQYKSPLIFKLLDSVIDVVASYHALQHV